MDLAALDDEQLVRRCQQGEAGAWSVLVRRYQRLVYTIPRRARLSDEASADVFQATFTRLFRKIDRVDDPSRIRAWLVTTARRETLRELQRAKPDLSGVPITDEFPGDDASEDDPSAPRLSQGSTGASNFEISDEERWDDVRQAVDRLEPRCRQLIELLFLTEPEPSYADIGQSLGMAVGSIGPTRGRCLGQLRKLMAER